MINKNVKRITYLILFCIVTIVLLECYVKISDSSGLRKKKDLIEKFGDNIDGFLIGASHMYRLVNAELMTGNVVSLALGGGGINVQHLLWQSIVKIRNPQYIVIELSCANLERKNTISWISKRKIPYYFDVDTEFHFRDLWATRYPPWKYISGNTYGKNIGTYGFENNISTQKNDFLRIGYDEDEMISLIKSKNLFEIIDTIDQKTNFENRKLINEILEHSANNDIRVFIITSPKYHLYNELMLDYHKDQLADYIQSIAHYKNVVYWDFSTLYENDAHSFYNLNHVMPETAEKFTEMLDFRIQKILHEK